MTQHVSWRWCFWINLPTGGIAMIFLLFFLNLNPTKKRSVREVASTFDFLGLLLLTAGTVLILFGLQEADTARNRWSAIQTIVPLGIGGLLLVFGAFNEIFTIREPIIPPRLFKTRTTTGILLATFIHAILFFSASYYVPLYFQILGSSATMAGIYQLPLTVSSAIISIISGVVLSKTGKYRPWLWFGFAVMTLGFGLMVMLDEKTNTAKQEIWQVVTGIGIGCMFQPPLLGLQAAMPTRDMATSTAVFALLRYVFTRFSFLSLYASLCSSSRTLGGTIGISIGDAIFSTEVARRLSNITDLPSLDIIASGGISSFTGLSQIQPDALRQQVLRIFTQSLSTIWIVWAPLAFLGLLCVLPVREYSLKRRFSRVVPQSGAQATYEKPLQASNTESISADRRSQEVPRSLTIEA